MSGVGSASLEPTYGSCIECGHNFATLYYADGCIVPAAASHRWDRCRSDLGREPSQLLRLRRSARFAGEPAPTGAEARGGGAPAVARGWPPSHAV